MIKTKVAFLEGRFYSANQNNLKCYQKALIGCWKKAGPPKKPLLFWSCKQATRLHLTKRKVIWNVTKLIKCWV